MKVFAKGQDGYRSWVNSELFRKGAFKAVIMHWQGVYPCCPISFR